MLKIRKRLAVAVARNFAAGLLQNAECALLESTGLTDEELGEMQAEMSRIAQRIEATINFEVLGHLGTRKDAVRRELACMSRT